MQLNNGNGLPVKMRKEDFLAESEERKWSFFYDCMVCLMVKVDDIQKSTQKTIKDKVLMVLGATVGGAIVMIPVAIAFLKYINELKSCTGGG